MSAAIVDVLRQWAAAEHENDAGELQNARTQRDSIIAALGLAAVPGAVYVVVCQNDKPHPRWGVDPGGPIVHETYVNAATLDNAHSRAAIMEQHGACRVARLVFEDEPGFAA